MGRHNQARSLRKFSPGLDNPINEMVNYTPHLLTERIAMPNWCYNSMTVRGPKEDLDRFIKAVTLPVNDGAKTSNGDDAGGFDLALIYPTPKELAETEAGFFSAEPHPAWAERLANGEMTQEWYDELVERNTKGYAKDQENIQKYGYKNWYDWNISNWGTKWSPRVERMELEEYQDGSSYIQTYYETAWSPATKLIQKISEKFPSLIFDVTFDEESMAYVGCEIFFRGQAYGADYDPHNPDNYPLEFQTKVAEVLAEMSDNSCQTEEDSERYWELHQDLMDLQNELKDEAERVASEEFLRDFPGAYAEI
jgi:hypothetical protein